MNILHFVSSIDKSTGGPARSITSAVQAFIDFSGYGSCIYTGLSEYPEMDLLLNPNETVKMFKTGLLGRFKQIEMPFSKKDYQILHGHGMWDIPIHQMSSYAKRYNIPYVLTPHGMLEPWALNQNILKKKIALTLYQKEDLKNAICIHATSDLEAQNIRNLGFKNPIAIIPNGISLIQIKSSDIEIKKNKRKLLFLSRIHHKKGIENLFLAWKKLPEQIKQNWTLEIVGEGEINYMKTLKSRIDELGIQNNVVIIGPLYDDKKNTAYQSADLFVLPTFSENFGMVIAEAMAFGLPVITTKGAPWEELQSHNAGWWIEIGVEPLTQALMEAMSTPKSTLIEMGKNGRKLIEDKYSIESVAKQMTELYEWILDKREKPDFVI